MQAYKNLGGDSNVAAFESGVDFIRVKFGDGSIYRYDYASAGQHNIEHMKSLAQAGRGLNGFINTTVKKRYTAKEF